MTSIEQRDVQSVLAGIDDLLPLIAKRAQATEDLRQPARRVRRRTRRGWVLQASAARAVGRPAVRSDDLLRGRPPHRKRLRIHRLGRLDHRRAQLAPRAVRPAGPGRSVGRGSRPRISSSYAPMGAGTVVDGGYLVNGSWNWSSGCDHATWAFARRPGDQGRQAGRLRQLPDPAQRLPHRRCLACCRAEGHRQQHARGQGRVRSAPSLPVLQGDERPHRGRSQQQHRSGVQDALGHSASHYHLSADRRDGLRCLRRARRAPGQACARRVRGREGQGRPVREGPNRRGGQ